MSYGELANISSIFHSFKTSDSVLVSRFLSGAPYLASLQDKVLEDWGNKSFPHQSVIANGIYHSNRKKN